MSGEVLTLVGAPGSPYSRKLRAVLRYRRIPFVWVQAGGPESRALPRPRVELLPQLVMHRADGTLEARTDSTPLIRELEALHPEREVVPPDPVVAFLDALLEDYADEWLSKAMFHYCWAFAPTAPARRAARALAVRDGRAARRERLRALRPAHAARRLRSDARGARARARAARARLGRRRRGPLRDRCATGRLGHARLGSRDSARAARRGRTRPCTLPARERGRARAGRVECTIDGRPWVQQPFPYQEKCLAWLRQARTALAPADRRAVDDLLAGSGCEALF